MVGEDCVTHGGILQRLGIRMGKWDSPALNDVQGTFRLANHQGPDNKIIDPGEALGGRTTSASAASVLVVCCDINCATQRSLAFKIDPSTQGERYTHNDGFPLRHGEFSPVDHSHRPRAALRQRVTPKRQPQLDCDGAHCMIADEQHAESIGPSPLFPSPRAVYADYASLMGRAAAHANRVVTWDEITSSKFQFCDYLEDLSYDAPPPVEADQDGYFPAPVAGEWKEI